MSALGTISTIVLDCAELGPLADFYGAVTGWKVTDQGDGYVVLGDGGPVQLGFQRVDGYRPPGWPDPAKQAHLDVSVADLATAEKAALALGATRPEFQPGGDDWVVLIDPAGHPFCLVPA
jgi:hypothetical protein